MGAPGRLTLLIAALLLAGCEGGVADGPGPNRGFLPGPAAPQDAAGGKAPLPLQRARLAGGDVVVEGPEGYCIDPATAVARPERGFAMIASCRILSQGRVGAVVEPLILTVTVGSRGEAGDLPTPGEIAEITGAALLGGDQSDGLSAANLDRGGDTVLEDGDARYWRGAFLQADRLVGLALYAPEGSAMAGPEGLVMLQAARARIAALSGAPAPQPTAAKAPDAPAPAATPEVAETAVAATAAPAPETPAALLGRLFAPRGTP